MSEYVLKRITSHPGKKIHFVTNKYLDDSEKGSERQRRAASGSIRIQLLKREQEQPKQFKKYLNEALTKLISLNFSWKTSQIT